MEKRKLPSVWKFNDDEWKVHISSESLKEKIEEKFNLEKSGVNVYFVSLTEKDPSDLGFEKMIDILYQTVKMKFSDLMRYKLNGKKKTPISLEI